MPGLETILNPLAYVEFIRRKLKRAKLDRNPNLRGTDVVPHGHYYSPLLDIAAIGESDTLVGFDGLEWWENVDLRPAGQREYFEDLLDNYSFLPFPESKESGFRYFTGNQWFRLPDAFTLSGIIRMEKPARIIEVGSGFSSAVTLDTLQVTGQAAELTFIEPNPERLVSLLSEDDHGRASIVARQVQEIPVEVFQRLEAGDVLFIDSSHVAKVGSDVTFLFLRVLPALKPGVLVHLHDIFYPYSYPMDWIREGYAWNESLMLRAFLVGNNSFEIVAFNSFAKHSFPELFAAKFPAFLEHNTGSLWLRKVR